MDILTKSLRDQTVVVAVVAENHRLNHLAVLEILHDL